MLILALDVGTSSARAVCFDEQGRALPGAEGRSVYEPVAMPDGGVELGAEALVGALADAVDQCLGQLGARARQIQAVGVSVFWHSLLALGSDGRPLTSVFTWADTRSAGAAAELSALLDERATHARTGAPLHSTFFPAKLRWLQQTRPEVFKRASTWCGFAEYLGLRLAGTLSVGLSMASGTGLLDQEARTWDPTLMDVCGIEPRQLPRLDDAPTERLAGGFMVRWPALARIPWFPAYGDGACSNIGSGCTGADRIALNVGTSAALRLITPSLSSTPWGLWRYRVDAGRSMVGGATSEGGNVVAWCRRTLALPAGDEEIERGIGALPPDGHGLTALPFFAGERSPGWRGDARAAISGMSIATGGLEILRALMESVAYRLGMIYEELARLAEPGHLVIASGGALLRSQVWTGMMADVLGVPVTLSLEPEASSRGAALLALQALGRDLPATLPRRRVFTPDPARHARYRAGLERQRRLYDNVVGPRGS